MMCHGVRTVFAPYLVRANFALLLYESGVLLPVCNWMQKVGEGEKEGGKGSFSSIEDFEGYKSVSIHEQEASFNKS